MRLSLGENVGEARDPRPGADDVQEIAMLACGPIRKLARGPRPRRRPGQPHEVRPAGIVLQVADDPVGSFPPSGRKVGTTDAFGILCQIAHEVFGLRIHGSTAAAIL